MLLAMNTDDDLELFEGAACAGSDLTARLFAELARASDSLAIAEARVHAAAAVAGVPGHMREEVRACRQHKNSLLRMLSGMPDFDGGGHVATA
jgi:hypothetical protein